jgi:hypothetical protein
MMRKNFFALFEKSAAKTLKLKNRSRKGTNDFLPFISL